MPAGFCVVVPIGSIVAEPRNPSKLVRLLTTPARAEHHPEGTGTIPGTVDEVQADPLFSWRDEPLGKLNAKGSDPGE
jgi:hypothetical protein